MMIANSAYGKKVPPEDVELTHVEPGSPYGEVLRRFWQPVALSEELLDLPKKVRIMCEDLVLFRTKKGDVGCVLPHCSHRGTSLEWGRIEENGIRCCYHGWLYNTTGKCVEMPCEPDGVCERMDVHQPAYPTLEYGGLVFIYMGPPGTEPLLPMYDIIDVRERDDVILKGMKLWDGEGIGFVKDCNWLQHYENAVDPWHLMILHQMISGDQFTSGLMHGGKPTIEFIETSLGVAYEFRRDLMNGNRIIRSLEAILPNIILVPNVHEPADIPKFQDKCTECTWTVPIDNEHLMAFSIAVWPMEEGKPKADWKPGTDTRTEIRPGSVEQSRTYEERQRKPDDREAQEGQRTIAIHALERLVTSDKGVVLLRRKMREQIKALQSNQDPQNVIRDAKLNRAIETRSWNTILSPETAEQ